MGRERPVAAVGVSERHCAKPPAGDRRATSAFWNLFRIVASAVSDGIASRTAAQDKRPAAGLGRLRKPPTLSRCRNTKRTQQPDVRITDPMLSQALAAFGRSSRGISSGSASSWIERAFPCVRLINPFSESVMSI